MQKPLFSIVTPTYNRLVSGFLEENIKSVQAQVGSFDYEHIFIDDGSTDGTEKFIKAKQKKDSRIKYFHKRNEGVAKAVKFGIGRALGKYTIILDDDDRLPSDSLQARANFIVENPQVSWSYGLAEWVDEFGLPTKQNFQSKFLKKHLYEHMLISNCIHGGTLTVKTDVLQEIKWPDWLERSQDYFLSLELLRPEKNLTVGFINQTIYTYRVHSDSYTQLINNFEAMQKKGELNNQIRNLHPQSFLAKEANFWKEEAHRTSDYWRMQIKPIKIELNDAKRMLNVYRSSRVIGRIIRLGNFYRRLMALFLSILRQFDVRIKASVRSLKLSRMPKVSTLENRKLPAKQPLVSVITPFYKRADTMPETVRSVLNQNLQNFEYIIVDDNSGDAESINYLNKLKHPKIRVIRQRENKGVAHARNRGISESRGKYVLCLDSDDIIEPTYLEKGAVIMESDPTISVVTFDTQMFGEREEVFSYKAFNPFSQNEQNQIITAALFRRAAWEVTGGYKSDIGYEDWEFWTNITKHGFIAKHVPEAIFHYRTSDNSRYISDLELHQDHVDFIKKLHPDYGSRIKKIMASHRAVKSIYSPESKYVNLSQSEKYKQINNNKPNVLIAVPWLTFGGAETLISNFSSELKKDFNLGIITGLPSANEWEVKFKETTQNIYHLPNLFGNQTDYYRFISNYIRTRSVDLLHIIHTSFVFDMLPQLKDEFPELKILVTIFNDRAHFEESLRVEKYIDVFSTDNLYVAGKYEKRISRLSPGDVEVLANGIDAEKTYNPTLYDRQIQRKRFGYMDDELVVCFIGRLSQEKNPAVFIEAAKSVIKDRSKKFKFIVIGTGPLRRQVVEGVSEARDKRLKYIGYRTDIAAQLSAADVFVLPSNTEGFPLSILEAMAMKVAVIASEVGAVPDIITNGENGLLMSPGSATELASKLEMLYKDRKMLNKIKNNSREEVVTKYSKSELGKNYKKLYRKVLK